MSRNANSKQLPVLRVTVTLADQTNPLLLLRKYGKKMLLCNFFVTHETYRPMSGARVVARRKMRGQGACSDHGRPVPVLSEKMDRLQSPVIFISVAGWIITMAKTTRTCERRSCQTDAASRPTGGVSAIKSRMKNLVLQGLAWVWCIAVRQSFRKPPPP